MERHLGAGQHLKTVFTRSTVAIKSKPLPKLDNINVIELSLMNGAAGVIEKEFINTLSFKVSSIHFFCQGPSRQEYKPKYFFPLKTITFIHKHYI